MLFSPKQTSDDRFSLYIRGKKINRTPVAKYLGIHIDEKLKFEVHVKHVCKKLSQTCGIFCYLRHYINQKTLLMLYHSFSELAYSVRNSSMGFNKSFSLTAIASPSKQNFKNYMQRQQKRSRKK